MAAGPQRPSGAATNFDYWLGRCQGFRVDSPHRRVGVVEEVRYASRCDRRDVIAVRPRRLHGLLFIVPVEEVAEIFQGAGRPAPLSAPDRGRAAPGPPRPGSVRGEAQNEEAEDFEAEATRIESPTGGGGSDHTATAPS